MFVFGGFGGGVAEEECDEPEAVSHPGECLTHRQPLYTFGDFGQEQEELSEAVSHGECLGCTQGLSGGVAGDDLPPMADFWTMPAEETGKPQTLLLQQVKLVGGRQQAAQ